jgi:hypothetical protein
MVLIEIPLPEHILCIISNQNSNENAMATTDGKGATGCAAEIAEDNQRGLIISDRGVENIHISASLKWMKTRANDDLSTKDAYICTFTAVQTPVP